MSEEAPRKMSGTHRALCAFAAFVHFACAVALAWEAGKLHGEHEYAAIMVGLIAALAFFTGLGYGLVTHLYDRDVM